MTDSHSTDAFWPRQMIPVTPETIKEVTRDGGERIAAASLEQIPRIPAGSIIHDNGCGAGAATAMIIASVAPEIASSLQIKGTDIDTAAIAAYNARSKYSSWPAEGLVMDSNALSFPDETFTHSIGNAMVFLTRNNGIDAVKEMYRTLKPGGTLLVNCFAYNPHLGAVREASRSTRPGGILPAWDSFEHWQDPAIIAGILEAGGFEKEKVKVQQRAVSVDVGDFDRHAEVTWSFRGMPSAGWSRLDEERWDEAVEILKRKIGKTEGFRILEDGSAVIRFVVSVATVVK
jgi:ubiquinone/menaquinone biosynthesis C-methylase UbiE